ncbi:hypothetical protein [Schlesneria paludicola]|uniref:hypothetical protein n=1 Tax=Schlesneria paludicola TaxID=360056 RepID=UPI00192AD593|nr:hypothetical protein [Schlesneria paludicola]
MALSLVVILCLRTAAGDDFENTPIYYSSTPAENRISKLQSRIDAGQVELARVGQQGYLAAVLRELEVPISSQMLVYSKTSLQRDRITPRTPRAIYFSDDVYVGYCHRGDVIEISTADPKLGAVFYTVSQLADTPRFERQTDNCLSCHGTTNTKGVPGHLVRSVYTDREGFPVLSMGTHRVDHTLPVEKRWGGWYVTGTHGVQTHLGNLMIEKTSQRDDVDNSAGQNVTSLQARFNTKAYLTDTSDLIALFVLEHQVEGHNLITRANFQTRQALASEARLNQELGESPDHRWDSANSRIRSACEALVKYLLFCDEAPLKGPMRGTTSFAEEFTHLGPRDSQGRSLRDLDLEHRLFRFPCSYLIYSRAFDELPPEAKALVWHRMEEVLSGADQSRPFSHLSLADRSAIREILCATKPGVPESWTTTQPDASPSK